MASFPCHTENESTGAAAQPPVVAGQNGSIDILSRLSVPCGRSGGFTIIELLVSMLVLVLLVVGVTMIVDATSKALKTSGQHMDSESQARFVFDRMANDFAKMVKRLDADSLLYKNMAADTSSGNDAMFFYSEAPAYYDASGTSRSRKNSVALVGYRINTANPAYPNAPVLERLGMGLTWDGNSAGSPGSPVFLTPNTMSLYPAAPDPSTTLAGNWGGSSSAPLGTLAGNYSNGSDPCAASADTGSYHVLCDLVYRMEIQFLLSDGTLSVRPVTDPPATKNNMAASSPPSVHDDSSSGSSRGSRWFDCTAGRGYICTSAAVGSAAWNLIGVQDIVAIEVTLAVLDSKSRKLIAGNLTGAPLLDAVSGTSVAQTWMAAVNNTVSFAAACGIPIAAASQVRIYQRTFYLAAP